LLGTKTSLFGWKDVQSTEESSEGNRFRPCAVSTGTLHDVRQATKQSFGGKMATESETFFATCVFYGTCSAILNILKSDKNHLNENLLCKNTEAKPKKWFEFVNKQGKSKILTEWFEAQGKKAME